MKTCIDLPVLISSRAVHARSSAAVLILLVATLVGSSVAAQSVTALRDAPLIAQAVSPPLRFQPYPAYLGWGPTRTPFKALADSDSVRKYSKQTQWKEGAIIGGATLGLLSAFVGYQLCGVDDSSGALSCAGQVLAGGLIGALMGGVIGGFAGSFVSKD